MTCLLGARVFTVVDVLDALTTDRPYRKAISYDAAKEEVRAESGTHFDSAVVEAFLSIGNDEWKQIAADVATAA